MGDFGRILDEWESMRASGRRRSRADDDERARREFEAAVARFPVEDKDRDAITDDTPRGPRADLLPVEDSLDLHGLTLDEALVATDRFLDASVSRGLRKVVVIHGKGRNGEGVLRREIRAYLERDRRTGAMGYGKGSEGGRGALWVVLKM